MNGKAPVSSKRDQWTAQPESTRTGALTKGSGFHGRLQLVTNWTSKKGVRQQIPDLFLPSDLLIVPPVGQSNGNLESKRAQSRKEEGEGADTKYQSDT